MSEPTTVTDALAAALKQQGVTRAWGMPGGDSLPLVASLGEVGVPVHLVRDEASAGFAADATAQLTGTTGVAMATLGPGLTNLVSGVAGALLDRAPVLAFTSRYRSDRHGSYTHMMLPQEKLFDATAKGWFRMTSANALGELHRALQLAHAPRPGPVWLEVPVEVASAPCGEGAVFAPPSPSPSAPDAALVKQVASWKRPVILCGFAARNTEVEALAHRLSAPVLTSYKAKGALPEGRGWSAGAAGLSPVADRLHQSLIAQADGVLLLGWDPAELRDQWLPGWPSTCPVVALDTHMPTDIPAELTRVHVGDLASAVSGLSGGASVWTLEEVAVHRASHDAFFEEGQTVGPATAIRAVQEAVGDEAVVAFDVGSHRVTASQVWHASRPDRVLQSNGFASMGYGLPAAIAAAAAGHKAVALIGDMGLQMSLGELMTASENGWPVVTVALVDDALSLIELKQERLGHPSRSVRFQNPSFAALGEAVGGVGALCTTRDELVTAIRQGFERDAPTVLGVPIDASWYRQQM